MRGTHAGNEDRDQFARMPRTGGEVVHHLLRAMPVFPESEATAASGAQPSGDADGGD